MFETTGFFARVSIKFFALALAAFWHYGRTQTVSCTRCLRNTYSRRCGCLQRGLGEHNANILEYGHLLTG